MNFYKTGLPSSNTSYKIGHICETRARTLWTIPQLPSSRQSRATQTRNPNASEQKPETLARTLRTIPQFPSSFWINNPGGNWGTEELGN